MRFSVTAVSTAPMRFVAGYETILGVIDDERFRDAFDDLVQTQAAQAVNGLIEHHLRRRAAGLDLTAVYNDFSAKALRTC